jgi:hypothetical protein
MVTTALHEPNPASDGAHEVVVSLLVLSEQYQALFDRGSQTAELEEWLQARERPGAWSVVDYMEHVAELLHSTSKRLLRVFDEPGRELSPPHLEAVSASARDASPRVALASLRAAAELLAHVVDEADRAAWLVSAKRGGTCVTAGELVAEALGETRRHLDDAANALSTAMAARPTP